MNESQETNVNDLDETTAAEQGIDSTGQADLPNDEPSAEDGDKANEATAGNATEEESAPELEAPKTPEEEILMWKETALRCKADLDNYRKRMTRERADTFKYANQGLLEELLPVLDNFEMGMMAANQDQESMIFKGMEMVQRQLGEFMTSQGLKEIPAEGIFDPNLHEAVSQELHPEMEEGQIIRVARRGFEYHGKLLRPANVIVAASPKEAEPDAQA